MAFRQQASAADSEVLEPSQGSAEERGSAAAALRGQDLRINSSAACLQNVTNCDDVDFVSDSYIVTIVSDMQDINVSLLATGGTFGGWSTMRARSQVDRLGFQAGLMVDVGGTPMPADDVWDIVASPGIMIPLPEPGSAPAGAAAGEL